MSHNREGGEKVSFVETQETFSLCPVGGVGKLCLLPVSVYDDIKQLIISHTNLCLILVMSIFQSRNKLLFYHTKMIRATFMIIRQE